MTTNLQSSNPAAPRGSVLIVVYAVLAVVGTVLPYIWFTPFLMEHGLNLGEFFAQAVANRISTAACVDILISSVVFWDFMWGESKRLNMRRWWLLIIPNLLVGLSCALPLFLLWREIRLRNAE